MVIGRKEHWENIYQSQKTHQHSWMQNNPTTSLELIGKSGIPKNAAIIDIGGGDSRLVDFLLREGYSDITVLDIAPASILRAEKRLGDDAQKVKWIESDILDFRPPGKYALWHDRAAFHFLIEPEAVRRYMNILSTSVTGQAIIGAFSTDGPDRCSGLPVKQYNEESLKALFREYHFVKTECKRSDHVTPGGVVQNFVYCAFQRNLIS
ncbi:MAG: class I SAM-dependent methyltransferase [Chitinophagaceae bacterium]